jgi:hypothetical protein
LVFGNKMPGVGVCLGHRRKIRAGQSLTLPENPESDHRGLPFSLGSESRPNADPPLPQAIGAVRLSVTVRYLTFARKAFVYFLRLLNY